ncbi:MAG TPA: AbrB/MazE/SpoVT family DNA-binding domain-containing protein [Thermomicrobiales bacterium]|nr:AbrB/MazE/SpoVT family DNA-binding domain-containing protein [Thermomicrobiales bacterium]
MLVKIGQRGTITIPKELREGLNENGLFEVVRRADGVIELRPQETIDATQRWFWTERWQRMEREADADIAAGRVATFDDVEAFLADLEDGSPR